MRVSKWWHVGLMALLAVTTSAFAEPLRIEVTEGVSRALPVAIVPFAGAAQSLESHDFGGTTDPRSRIEFPSHKRLIISISGSKMGDGSGLLRILS